MDNSNKTNALPYGLVLCSWLLAGIIFAIIFGLFSGMLAGGTMFMLTFGVIISAFGGITNCSFLKFQSRKGSFDTLSSVGSTMLILFFVFIAVGASGIFNYT